MSHSLSAALTLFAPLGRLFRPRSRPDIRTAAGPSLRHGTYHASVPRPAVPPPARPLVTSVVHRQRRLPLRVVRVIDAGQASTLAGRILMSGRMADVCAELDRMVEREAAMHSAA